MPFSSKLCSHGWLIKWCSQRIQTELSWLSYETRHQCWLCLLLWGIPMLCATLMTVLRKASHINLDYSVIHLNGTCLDWLKSLRYFRRYSTAILIPYVLRSVVVVLIRTTLQRRLNIDHFTVPVTWCLQKEMQQLNICFDLL